MNTTTRTTTNTIESLKDCDVVCGRGGLANKHPGNRMLRRICNVNRALYQSSVNPRHKQCLILSILMAIQQYGGRFVALNTKNGYWEEIPEKKAKEKVAQLLRESGAYLEAAAARRRVVHFSVSDIKHSQSAPHKDLTSKRDEVIKLDPTADDEEVDIKVKPITIIQTKQPQWTNEDFQSLKSAFQLIESFDQ